MIKEMPLSSREIIGSQNTTPSYKYVSTENSPRNSGTLFDAYVKTLNVKDFRSPRVSGLNDWDGKIRSP